MSTKPQNKKEAFSLVEIVISLGVFAILITGILGSLGQARLMSDKSSKQAIADFYLRTETESIRGMSWAEVKAHYTTISNYAASNSGDPYPLANGIQASDISARDLTLSVTADELSASGETEKIIFRVLITWTDMIGRTHEESRVFIITEGGLSAT